VKVRCIQLLDALGGARETSPWLTLAKDYHVLSLIFDANGTWLVRLWTDAETIGLFPLRQFEILDPKVPASWIATWNRHGVFELTSPSWAQEGFWDRFYEHDADAVQTVHREMVKIVAE